VDKARELVEEVEALFQGDYVKWCAPPQIGKVTIKGIFYFSLSLWLLIMSFTVLEARDLAKRDVIGNNLPSPSMDVSF
jgi:hypothetical protein